MKAVTAEEFYARAIERRGRAAHVRDQVLAAARVSLKSKLTPMARALIERRLGEFEEAFASGEMAGAVEAALSIGQFSGAARFASELPPIVRLEQSEAARAAQLKRRRQGRSALVEAVRAAMARTMTRSSKSVEYAELIQGDVEAVLGREVSKWTIRDAVRACLSEPPGR